jgi:hypothetical protein
MPSKSSKSKKRGGADGTWSGFFSDYTPGFLKSKPVETPPVQPVSSEVLPAPAQQAVVKTQEMAKTAGRRLKKHVGYDIASGKSMRKLFGTAKGDYMLGGKRRRRKTRRHH